MEILRETYTPVEVSPTIEGFDEDPAPGTAYGQEPYLYLLSSKAGFGHASRAVAVAQELGPEAPITFAAHVNAHQFIENNLLDLNPDTRVDNLDYDYEMTHDAFTRANAPLLETIGDSKLVINDFLVQVPAVRSVMDSYGFTQPLIGIYHSIDGYRTDDIHIKQYQERHKRIAGCLDYLFLTEPKPEHAEPYEIEGGSIVIPCDPIVRRPFLDAEDVKADLGLQPDDEFIYVQGGMQGNNELRTFVASLKGLSLGGLKIVLAPFKRSQDTVMVSGPDVIYMKQRLDAHNVVAASAGIISKPGMGITCEAIANRKPILLVDHAGSEERLKFTMLEEILGDELPIRLDTNAPLATQIGEWLEASEEISQKFGGIPCNGASKVARMLPALSSQAQISLTA